MDPPAHALADWLDLDDGVLTIDVASHLEVANLARLLDRLERRQHRMALLLQAMVQQLEAQGLLSQKPLLVRAQAIDLNDPVTVGRPAHQLRLHCSRCGRETPITPQRCLYCGSDDLRGLAGQG